MGIEMLGPISIPDFVDIYSSAIANAWNLQRLLDREMGLDPKPIETRYKTIEDNIDGIIDWFAQAKKEVKIVMDPFLTI